MRASRLLTLLMLLQTRGRLTARQLADEVGVSVRTIYRDIDSLSEAGVPIYGDPGPAGGYALVEGYRTRLTGLTSGEASALFLAGLPGPAAELGLGSLLTTAELKLMAALPAGLRESAALARERFLLDAPGWFRVEDQSPHLAAIATAVWEERPLRMRYRGRDGEGERNVDPLGLVLKSGVWYLVALRDAGVRTYRVSRIDAAEVLEGQLHRPPDFDLAAYWDTASAQFLARLYGRQVTARLSPRGMDLLPRLLDAWVARTTLASAGEPDAGGWIEVTIPVESDEIAFPQLLQFGPDLEVLEPVDLRERMASAARDLAHLYACSGRSTIGDDANDANSAP